MPRRDRPGLVPGTQGDVNPRTWFSSRLFPLALMPLALILAWFSGRLFPLALMPLALLLADLVPGTQADVNPRTWFSSWLFPLALMPLALILVLTLPANSRFYWSSEPVHQRTLNTHPDHVPWRQIDDAITDYHDAIDLLIARGHTHEKAQAETIERFDAYDIEEKRILALPEDQQRDAFDKLNSDSGWIPSEVKGEWKMKKPDGIEDVNEQYWIAKSFVWYANHLDGEEKERKIREVVHTYQQAADAGHVDAMIELVEVVMMRCERTGIDGACSSSDQQVINQAYYDAGLHYYEGKGIDQKGLKIVQNYPTAMMFLQKAVAGGHVEAQARLDDLQARL